MSDNDPCDGCQGCGTALNLPPAARQPYGEQTLYGGVFVKEMRIPDAGTIVPTHSHHYDHTSYLAQGSVRVWKDGEDLGEFHAPCAIKIPAHAKHRIMSLCDEAVVLCIHAVALGEADFNEADLIHEPHQIVRMV